MNNNNNNNDRDMMITVSFIVKESDIFDYCQKHNLIYEQGDAVESLLGCKKWYDFLTKHKDNHADIVDCEICEE